MANKPGVRVVLGGGPSPFRCPCSACASVSARRACKELYRYLNTVNGGRCFSLGKKTQTSSVCRCRRPTHLVVARSRFCQSFSAVSRSVQQRCLCRTGGIVINIITFGTGTYVRRVYLGILKSIQAMHVVIQLIYAQWHALLVPVRATRLPRYRAMYVS